LTVLVARFVQPGAGEFLLLFNITVITAVCFRWGLDELIVRRIATVRAGGREPATSHLLALAHRRVIAWYVLCAGGGVAALPLLRSRDVSVTLAQLQISLIIGALVALTSCAGRVVQGAGRTNTAAFLLNVLYPAALVVGLTTLALVHESVQVWALLVVYLVVAAVAYAVVVGVVMRGRIPRVEPGRSGDDRRAATRLGGVVLAQQALGWVVLLVVPVIYGAETYVGFSVTYKVANLVNLVMLAVNFTFAARVASLFHAGDVGELRRLTRLMLTVVAVSSLGAGAAVLVCRDLVYQLAGVNADMDAVLLILVVAQVFFALAAVCALVLNMCGVEKRLLQVQGAVGAVGVVAYLALAKLAPLEVSTSVLAITYAGLFFLLLRLVGRATQPLEDSA
jgi:O-antigen/teichoic acid export membrane protein